MYQEYFQLAESPFNAGPDPKFLYLTDSIREALATLAYGVNNRKGFILLTGDVGTGKTTILNVFMDWLEAQGASTAFVFNPHLNPDDFLKIVWTDFGIEQGRDGKSECIVRFSNWLLDRYRAQRPVVLFVDEAQQLSEEVLEELRLLTNLETPKHKLLQIVLCGQPELNGLISRPSLRQLRQRIALRCNTSPLTVEQTSEYINMRLRIAGSREITLFDMEAISFIHRISGGIPRVINLLCEQSMINAYCDGRKAIDANMVRQVAAEIQPDTEPIVTEKRRAGTCAVNRMG
jgi:type II secretory pathway predicted ATPase ExeA